MYTEAALVAFLTSLLPVSESPTFYRDIVPILQRHCQVCHRPGQIAPMSLLTYAQTRPWAKSIREAVLLKKMPPWFADPRFGKFANDPSLSAEEVSLLTRWVDAGAVPGPPVAIRKPSDPNIAIPDAILGMPRAFRIPAKGEVEYQYVVIPTGFTEDKWVQGVELLPSAREVVHHAVVYIREPGSQWLSEAKPGIPYSIPEDEPSHRSLATTSDLLLVYAPGNPPVRFPDGMAKLIPGGSDLVLQMHYTPNGKPAKDQTKIALRFAGQPVKKRVLTLQMGNDKFVIPPGHPHFAVAASGTLPNDAELLSLFPHMHLRGQSFTFAWIHPGGKRETLLAVNRYDFHWQLSYLLASPLELPVEAKLEWTAHYDNSKGNPHNPDPSEAVRYGEQSRAEMMIGFFEVAVPAGVDKQRFFIRR